MHATVRLAIRRKHAAAVQTAKQIAARIGGAVVDNTGDGQSGQAARSKSMRGSVHGPQPTVPWRTLHAERFPRGASAALLPRPRLAEPRPGRTGRRAGAPLRSIYDVDCPGRARFGCFQGHAFRACNENARRCGGRLRSLCPRVLSPGGGGESGQGGGSSDKADLITETLMHAIKIATTVDEATARAIPALRPLLGKRVELIALQSETDATSADEHRLTVDELLAARLTPPPGVGPISLEDMGRRSLRSKT
jgi:hypothetical protein